MHELLGQDRAVSVLQTQLATGRIHHAYIFHGPPGVGKFTAALAFARILLCHDRQTDLAGRVVACGSCASCRLLRPDTSSQESADAPADLSAAHPDLHVVTKELARYSDDRSTRERKLTQIPVEVLRSHVLEPVYRAAQLRHGKVFILDEAELLNATGQNLLLKTLEEPPAGTTLVLVTASEDRLLPTIRSRCQRVAFVPLPDEVIERWAQEHAGELIERDRRWLVAFAGGSLGRARLALSYGLTQWAEAVLPSLDRMVQGQPSGELGGRIAELIDAFAQAWVDRHENASKEAANKLAADLMGSLIAGHARRQLAALAERCAPADPEAAEAAMQPWLNVIDAVGDTQRFLAANVNLSLACDHLAMAMARGGGVRV